MPANWEDLDFKSKCDTLKECLNNAYLIAEKVVNGEEDKDHLLDYTSADLLNEAAELGATKHAFRGAALTLLSYKACHPQQDIRAHKAEYDGGISARSFDTTVTVPFLIEKSLPRSVESHWLTQTLSFAGPLTSDSTLKTTPKKAGPLLISVVNNANKDDTGVVANALMTAILIELIEIRNKDRVDLTRPKHLPIDAIKALLNCHMSASYNTGAPRLPQIAIYAIYKCLLGEMKRFEGKELEPLARMKSADRKAGTVGDIVVLKDDEPDEAVEIKLGQPITLIHVLEAIEKVRSESVSRYYLLSTAGISEEDTDEIHKKKDEFLKQNGCEIIVNGVIETISYYLRLLPDTTTFLKYYADILEADHDVGYEHRIRWNECCRSV